MQLIKTFFLIILFLLSSACATVAQIDRGRLAKKTMQFDSFSHADSFRDEMHADREGSAGGVGQSAGGGCGCN